MVFGEWKQARELLRAESLMDISEKLRTKERAAFRKSIEDLEHQLLAVQHENLELFRSVSETQQEEQELRTALQKSHKAEADMTEQLSYGDAFMHYLKKQLEHGPATTAAE